MYNKSLKNQYLESKDISKSTKKYSAKLFRLSEPYETKWGNDLYEASEEELSDALGKILGISSNTRGVAYSALKRYIRWCKDNKIDNVSDSIFRIQIAGLEKIRTKMTSGPKHLQKYLDSIYDNEDEKTTDNIYRCYSWLAFMGIRERDILKIKTSDVDLYNRVVRIDYSEYKIYEESFKVFQYLKKLEWFVYKHPNYSKDIIRYRVGGDLLLRGVRGERNAAELKGEVFKKRKLAIENGVKIDEDLTYLKIFRSGYFYRIYELERAGYPISFTELVEIEMDGKDYSGGEKGFRSIALSRIRHAQEDYELWKLAFER